jgi:adenylylsulfate kinase-like enzyme
MRCRLVAASEIVTGVAVDARVPVLWICGPAGVGKSTVSWQLYKTGGLAVGTTGLSPDESASVIGNAIGWP